MSGDYSLVEGIVASYDPTQILSGSMVYTLVESGADAATNDESGNTVTGDYSRSSSGTDGYELSQWGTNGGSYSVDVSGSEDYSADESGNRAQQVYGRTTTGDGSYSRSATGSSGLSSGTGTNAYTLTEANDDLVGHFSHSETGTDR
ncbi:MAG: hypothetical protein U0791_06910 [Gemmataceae bacterium]